MDRAESDAIAKPDSPAAPHHALDVRDARRAFW